MRDFHATEATLRKLVEAVAGGATDEGLAPIAAALEDIANAIQATSDAEAWAVGTRNGIPVDSSDPTYHNNAKYYAEQAGQ